MGLEEILFIVFSLLSFLSAIGAILARSLVYSAFSLGLLGVFAGALFVLAGYTYLGIFMIAVYSGAVVIFILLIAMMFRVVPKISRGASILAFLASTIFAIALAFIYFNKLNSLTERILSLGLDPVSVLLVKKPLYLYIITFTLAATMIEVMALIAKVKTR